MRPGFLAVLAGGLLAFSGGGVMGQAVFEGGWRHNDAGEDKNPGTESVDMNSAADGGFVGKFSIRNECANGSDREFYIKGRFDGSLDGILAAPSVSGTLTRCTNPELLKKCKKEHPDKTYEVPFEGVAVWLGQHPINKTLTMVIRFKDDEWDIPHCKKKPRPKTYTVTYELVVPRQPQRPRAGSSLDDCARAAVDKFLKQDPTPLIERCR
jgi:hypothetical protein